MKNILPLFGFLLSISLCIDGEKFTLKANYNGVIPYIALLSSRSGQNIGVIIHSEWILTSAHNLVDKKGVLLHDSDFEVGVLLSSIYLQNWKEIMKYKSRRVVVHEDYLKNMTKSDIGLIQTEVLQINNYVIPINIHGKPWPTTEYRKCFEIEWERGVDPPNKYKYYLTTWEVKAYHGKNACPCMKNMDNLENYICLSGKCGCTYCTGNMGGVVVCDSELVGITNRIVDCRNCENPLIICPMQNIYRMYTYVCPYRRWISNYVSSPTDLKYDVVCSHFISKRNVETETRSINLPFVFILFTILLTIMFIIVLYPIRKIVKR